MATGGTGKWFWRNILWGFALSRWWLGFLLGVEAGWAQAPIQGEVWLGMTLTQVDGDSYAGYHKVGIGGGVGAWLWMTPAFFTRVSLGYMQKGSRHTPALGYPPEFYRLSLHYVDVGVQVGFADRGGLVLGAGIVVGRLVGFREEVARRPVRHSENPFYGMDLLFQGEGGLRKGKWLVAVQFQYSLGNIRRVLPAGAPVPWQKNNVLWIGLKRLLGPFPEKVRKNLEA